MKAAKDVAAALVAVEMGRGPRPFLGDVERRLEAALDEYARDFHAARLREALGALAPEGRAADHARGLLAAYSDRPDHLDAHAVTFGDLRRLLAALDHYRDLACATRHDNGYRDGWEAGLAEGMKRAREAAKAAAAACRNPNPFAADWPVSESPDALAVLKAVLEAG